MAAKATMINGSRWQRHTLVQQRWNLPVRKCRTASSAWATGQVAIHGGIYSPLHVINWPYLDIVSATVGGHLLSLVRRCLTLCLTIYEILQSAHRPSDSRWRLIFSLPIITYSALGVSHVMRSINVRYLLTYLLTNLFMRLLSHTHTRTRLVLSRDANAPGKCVQFESRLDTFRLCVIWAAVNSA